MKTKKSLLIAATFVFAAFACNSNKSTDSTSQKDEIAYEDTIHTSRSALDYEGTYAGILPCADCDGIYTEITLKGNNYTIKRQYQGRGNETENTFTDSGTYSWDKTGRIITMSVDTLEKYQVGENVLIALDREGKKITGELADKYVLNKLTMDN